MGYLLVCKCAATCGSGSSTVELYTIEYGRLRRPGVSSMIPFGYWILDIGRCWTAAAFTLSGIVLATESGVLGDKKPP
jgi:hypothetical protein